MNAGKSTMLLQAAHNYKENGSKTLQYTSQIDDRYGVGKITSRLGPSADALTFDREFDFLKSLENNLEGIACIFIDEAQFLTKAQVQQLHYIAACLGVPVIAYGIRTDSKGEPFEGAIYLLALAETVEEIKTICRCDRKATMNMRVDANGEMVVDGEQIVIGGNDSYRQVCAKCFYTTRKARIAALASAKAQ